MATEAKGGARMWVVDTSSLLHIRNLRAIGAPRDRVYTKLTELVDENALVYPKEVWKELKDGVDAVGHGDKAFQWCDESKMKSCKHGSDYDHVKQVLAEVPNLVDHNKPSDKEDADPYVLSLALRLQLEAASPVSVVTNDYRDKGDRWSLSSACGYMDVVSLPLAAFLRRLGL